MHTTEDRTEKCKATILEGGHGSFGSFYVIACSKMKLSTNFKNNSIPYERKRRHQMNFTMKGYPHNFWGGSWGCIGPKLGKMDHFLQVLILFHSHHPEL